MAKISVFSIEYELVMKNMESWKCKIAATSHEEAIQHLYKRVGPRIHISSSGFYCDIDDMSDSVRKMLQFGERKQLNKKLEEAVEEKKPEQEFNTLAKNIEEEKVAASKIINKPPVKKNS